MEIPNIKVSVIVAVYNGEKYIEECLNSLAVQTLKEIEIIVVNDASTDTTVKRLQVLQNKMRNLKVVSLQNNVKQGGARNIGFKMALGEYIAYCDADDWVSEDMYEKMYETAKEGAFDCVSCYYMKHHENGVVSLRNNIRGWARIYKRDLIISNSIYFPENILYEDIFFQRIVNLYIKKHAIREEHFYHYRSHSESTTHHLTHDIMLDRIQIEFMLLDELEKRKLESSPFSEQTNIEFMSRCILANMQAWVQKVGELPDREIISKIRKKAKKSLPEHRQYFSSFEKTGRILLHLFFLNEYVFMLGMHFFENHLEQWGKYNFKE